jgi:pimeloyl-ACP methyl ester carboxylesterase
MSSLHQQLSGAGHAVLLTDARGVILNCVTAPAERKIFERAGLWLGADWSEACEGTNGSTGVKSGSTANIDLKPGGSVSCLFTNVKAGHIIVKKVTDPTADPASFEFDSNYGANFFLTDGQSNDSGELKPGTYSVAELTKAGWDLSTATCDDASPVEAIGVISSPTLLVHGTADAYFHPGHVLTLQRASTDAEVWIEPGMGHGETATRSDLVDRIAAWSAGAGPAVDPS